MTESGHYRYLWNVNQEITLPPGETPKKLENFLKKRFPIGYVRKLFRKNGVRLNGKRAQAEDPVEPGDRIELYIPFETKGKSLRQRELEKGKLDTIFEDDDLLVISKPAGVAVHEGKEVLKRDSILGMLEAKYRETGLAPKLVHRIDKDTSGLLVAAKNPDSAEVLERLFAEGKVEKEYLSLVVGRMIQSDGKIDFPLPGRDGKPVRALTRFRVVRRFLETTLVKVKIETGRMHQIRLHLAKLGYPVVMDDQHGDFAFNKRFQKTYGLKRQFLHADSLRLEYRGKKRTWTAPLPADLKRTMDLIESESAKRRNF